MSSRKVSLKRKILSCKMLIFNFRHKSIDFESFVDTKIDNLSIEDFEKARYRYEKELITLINKI